MTTTWLKLNLGPKEERWVQMMTLSVVFHLAIFFTTLIISKNTIYYPFLEERIYHVELVGSPPPPTLSGGTSGVSGATRKETSGVSVATRKETSTILDSTTRRIAGNKKPTATVVAKRVSPKPITAPKEKETISPSELIEGAISRIEKKVTVEETNRLEDTISRLESKLEKSNKEEPKKTTPTSEGEGTTSSRGRAGGLAVMSSGIGKGIQLYQMEIETAIKNNWSYPVALLHAIKGKTPEAVILLTVRSDGKIVKATFKKRSRDSLFNDSVMKAIERSDPLPKFPPGYRKSYDDVEINFSLKDLIT
jgi:colicin import membrane protein